MPFFGQVTGANQGVVARSDYGYPLTTFHRMAFPLVRQVAQQVIVFVLVAVYTLSV
jgi:hypothetical protein